MEEEMGSVTISSHAPLASHVNCTWLPRGRIVKNENAVPEDGIHFLPMLRG